MSACAKGSMAIYFLYNSLLLLASPVLAVYLARRLLIGKSREGWQERLGRLPEGLAEKRGPRVWLHAASVGEVMAALPVIKLMRERMPCHEFILSTITPGGHETAVKTAGVYVRSVVYLPFDLPFAVRRALKVIQPDILAIFETELWPNLLCLAKRSGARTILLNGRISDKSTARYRRARWLFSWVLGQFHRILAQSGRDAERLVAMGGDPERVSVAGNSKFDETTSKLDSDAVALLRKELKLGEVAPVLVAGSTRSAEEVDIVLNAYVSARENLPELKLIVAPRHVDRSEEVVQKMKAIGLQPVRRTELAHHEGTVSHLVLDTFGELAKVYSVGNMAFIGNSLIPPGGGQNLLQPLAQGKPVIHGPYVSNFRDICAMAADAGVSVCVRDASDLAEAVVRLVKNRDECRAMGDRAIEIVQANQGASSRFVDELMALGEAKPPAGGQRVSAGRSGT